MGAVMIGIKLNPDKSDVLFRNPAFSRTIALTSPTVSPLSFCAAAHSQQHAGEYCGQDKTSAPYPAFPVPCFPHPNRSLLIWLRPFFTYYATV